MPRYQKPINALPDPSRVNSDTGVAVVVSYQVTPVTNRPYKIKGVWETDKTMRQVIISLTKEEALQLEMSLSRMRAEAEVLKLQKAKS